jgi:nitrate/nitrite transport system substrate-binding protein
MRTPDDPMTGGQQRRGSEGADCAQGARQGGFSARPTQKRGGAPEHQHGEGIRRDMSKTTRAAAAGKAMSRRDLLKSASATATAAALMSAVKAAFPSGACAQGSGPEVKGTKLGYIALTDASPLIIAKEKGFYAKHGLPDMEILKQASWGATRDNMALGTKANGIDGGHILRPKTHLYTTGKVIQNNQPLPMYTLLSLNEDCQALSVSNEYKTLDVGTDCSALKAAFAAKKASGKEVKVAMTFPGGTHDLWIRYWLAAGGIDPDRDVSTIVVPPPQMVANMKVGNMDAFCVGEPWNEQLVNQDIGFTAATTGEIWFKHPEKILGMRADWVDANPKATQAILMAVMEAQQWCERMENKEEMATIIGRRQWFNVPVPDIIGRIRGDINYGRGRVVTGSNLLMKFWGQSGAVSYPWKSLDAWFITENIRWGKFEPMLDVQGLVDRTNRSDLWREAARTLGIAGHPTGASRGVERFFDGKTFDPADTQAYLRSLSIKRAVV